MSCVWKNNSDLQKYPHRNGGLILAVVYAQDAKTFAYDI